MAYLTAIYDKHLAAVGFSHVKCNRARFREDIERMIPYIKPAVQKNRYWHLVFDDDLSKSVADMKDNTSSEVSTLHKAAQILPKEYLNINHALFVCLFDMILYVPSTIFQLNRDGFSWVEPVLSWDKCVLLKDHNTVTPVRLVPSALRSRVKHSTTEPLRSLHKPCVHMILFKFKRQ